MLSRHAAMKPSCAYSGNEHDVLPHVDIGQVAMPHESLSANSKNYLVRSLQQHLIATKQINSTWQCRESIKLWCALDNYSITKNISKKMDDVRERERTAVAIEPGLQRQREVASARTARPATQRVRNPSFSVSKIRAVSFAKKEKEEEKSALNASPWGVEPQASAASEKPDNPADEMPQNRLLKKLSSAGDKKKGNAKVPALSTSSVNKVGDTLSTSPVSPPGIKKSVSLLPSEAAQIKQELHPPAAKAPSNALDKQPQHVSLSRKENVLIPTKLKSSDARELRSTPLEISDSSEEDEVVTVVDTETDLFSGGETPMRPDSSPASPKEKTAPTMVSSQTSNAENSVIKVESNKPKTRMQDFSERLLSKFGRTEVSADDNCVAPCSKGKVFGLRKVGLLSGGHKAKAGEAEASCSHANGSCDSEASESEKNAVKAPDSSDTLSKDDFVSYQTRNKSEKGHWRKFFHPNHHKGR